MKFTDRFKSRTMHAVIIAGIILFASFAPDIILQDFNPEQQRTVLLLLLAIYLWTFSKMPTGAASILLLAMIIILNLTDSVEEAMAGFLSSALYFILILSILSQVLIKVDADKVISSKILGLENITPRKIVQILPVFMSLLPVLIPSAFARLKTVLPFVDSMNEAFGFPDDSVFKKYALYVTGLVNQNSTMIVYTGGGYPVLAAQLLKDYEIADLGWSGWFLIIAPPLWCALIVTSIFSWFYLKLSYPSESAESFTIEKNPPGTDYYEYKPTKRFWFVIMTFSLMILTWIFTDPGQLPTLLPPMILLVLYALPKIELITNEDIRAFNWENFLLIGASLSIGVILDQNGTARMIAEQLISLVPEDAGIVINIIIVAIIMFLFRMIFIVPTSAVIVIFPVMIPYAEMTGIPALTLAFIVIMIIGGTNILPIHSPTLYFAFKEGVLSRKDHYMMAVFSSLTFLIISILAALLYWNLWS
ncbi:MAG TPA: anion permease [Candidatus Salinicoccus stercoripullorum]|uniref:Anion permease n=1 Tax=Candidatus Salinicoccus stercoripullorum TaxID=2838756 RepID=A0A9D1U1N2_9STAP|nr:anion permease [Candidatus Salinicoccus stercoripullorum]